MYYYVVVKYGDTSERRIILKFPTLNLYLNLIKKGFWGTGIGYNVMETSKILQMLRPFGGAPMRLHIVRSCASHSFRMVNADPAHPPLCKLCADSLP